MNNLYRSQKPVSLFVCVILKTCQLKLITFKVPTGIFKLLSISVLQKHCITLITFYFSIFIYAGNFTSLVINRIEEVG